MKIAVMIDPVLRPTIMAEEVLGALRSLGEVTLNADGRVDADAAKALIRGSCVAVTSWGNERLTADVLAAAPNLKLVVHAAGSVKGIVSDALYDRGIRVSSCARVLSEGVSDTALGLTICAAKNVFAFHEGIQKGGWVDNYTAVMEMSGITVGIIGFGFAGARYAELLRAFDVQVLAYDPFVDAMQMEAAGAKKTELSDLLANSDIVSLHAPAIDSTYHMINAETLGQMKDGAVLINTARGSLVDEAALACALTHGKLKYACLDVTDPEPPALDSPLRTIPNCIMTPHIAGLANNGKLKIGRSVLDEIRRALEGRPLLGEVTRGMLATMA